MKIKTGWLTLLLTSLLVVPLVGCTSTPSKVMIDHVTGIGYSKDGQSLYVATQGNFIVHQSKGWLPLPNYDVKNISTTLLQGIYISGHHGIGKLPNPLSLAKSTDDGKTFNPIGFQEDFEFDKMAASYRRGTLYTYSNFNGLNYTKDDGKEWTHVKMDELDGELTALAVHPEEDDLVAFGTATGVYFSEDYGKTIQYGLGYFKDVTALAFDLDKDDLLYVATGGDQPSVYPCGNYRQISSAQKGGFNHYGPLFTLPRGNVITQMAYNPKNEKIAIVTDTNEIYEFDKRNRLLNHLVQAGEVKFTNQ